MLLNCPKCHYPLNHPFGLTINELECSGCLTHKEKDQINWDDKANELDFILGRFKKQHSRYDCVVPVVGDAEDYYTLSKVLGAGLSPLVVCVNDYFKNDIGWHNLHNLITHFDVDSFVFNPDIRVYKDLVRTSLRKFDHIMLPFLQLHTAFPVHIAHERKIPLIIWGQNQAVEQVGKCSHYDAIEMSRWSRREHDLFNVEVEYLIGNGAQVDERHLNYYHYPKIELLDKAKIKGLYLSNYFRWDPLKQNHSVIKFGFIPQENNSSFDIYERAGSSVYYGLHDILKYKRLGYRKISDHVAREIRHGRITTTQGRDIINTYTARKVFIKPFFDWLGVSNEGYEWFKMHRLDSVKGLISDVEATSEPIRLPDSLNCMLQDSVCSEKKIIIYGKGVKI
ncbi:putative LPS biosynthesis protein [Vibrio cholerae]|uniref:N-acetyl sugar amidotransferase n=1 Tax=Vibrio cholerae TaxID=666 RepID=UPI0011DBF938|nr:N-acetyl sugar amidotransferase [Vibrio cholerae]TXY18660.1 N-acetyl sugar amidotransferase [Vibrio cholerae]BCN17041.1 putative monosaccharide biosynthesis protein [Vibrio cholerae]GHY11226.1 putative LPS biosynthesis protein [Vibrio cholerae]